MREKRYIKSWRKMLTSFAAATALLGIGIGAVQPAQATPGKLKS